MFAGEECGRGGRQTKLEAQVPMVSCRYSLRIALHYTLHTTSTDFKPNVYSYGERENYRAIQHTSSHTSTCPCSRVCSRARIAVYLYVCKTLIILLVVKSR